LKIGCLDMKKASTYNYSSAEIIERGTLVAKLAEEDLQCFQKYGITQKDIDILYKRLDEYKRYPEDSFFAEKVKARTREKNEQENRLVTQIRSFFLRFSIIVPTKKETKKYFPSQKLTGIKTKELVEIGEKVLVVFKKFKDRLLKYDLTEEDILNIKAQISATKKVVKALEAVRLERTRNTTKRREIGTVLYEKIASLSHYGKTYWKDRDDKRYKDYLLYEKNYLEQKQRNKERDEMFRAKELARINVKK